jgi:Ca-activated chloride channel family protein
VTGRTAEGQPFRQTLTPVETSDSAMRTLWARARVHDLEHRFTAGHLEPGLSDAIIAFSLKYSVL